MQARRKWNNIVKALKEKLPTNHTLPRKVIIQSEGEMKNFPDKQKLNFSSPLTWPYKKCQRDFKLKKRVLISNKKTHGRINLTEKVNIYRNGSG